MEQLLPLVYDELRKLAAAKLAHEKPGQTLQATALAKLEAKDRRKAELVKLRFFAGLTNDQAAEALGIATSTADADWSYAKAWLRVEMAGERRSAGRN